MQALLIFITAALSASLAAHSPLLHFEPNRGQAGSQVRWIARTPDAAALIDDSGFTLRRRNAPSLRFQLAGAESAPVWRTGKRLAGVTNYYLTDVSATAVPHYDSVIAAGTYPGIDLRLHSAQRQLEYDFIVQPGADPRRIAVRIEGVPLKIDSTGALIADGTRIERPVAWQGSQNIPVRFRLSRGNVGFDVGKYDHGKPLTIDPVVVSLAYSTLLGGAGSDTVSGMAVNALGEMHVAGDTDMPDFNSPIALTGLRDIFVAKLNATGTAYVWLTFFGGPDRDTASKLALDAGGNVIVGGETRSPSGLATTGAPQTAFGGGEDAFVAKLNSNGQLTWATYLGGTQTETLTGLAVAADSSIVAGGTTGSSNFPTTTGVWRVGPVPLPFQHGFVTRLSPSGGRVWSTYLRRESTVIGTPLANNVSVTALALDSSGNVVIAGNQNDGLPVTDGYPYSFYNYLMKLRSDGTAPLWVGGQAATGAYGSTLALALDASNRIYLTEPICELCTIGQFNLHVISADGKTTEKQILLGSMGSLRSLAVSADGQQVWFGGSSSLSAMRPLNAPAALYPYGLYRSTDAGTTWAKEASPNGLIFDFQASPSFLYARTSNALWRKPLAGGSWTLVVQRPMNAFGVAGDQVIYIAGDGTLSRSNDAGATWSAPIPTPVPIYGVAAMATQPDRVMITASATGHQFFNLGPPTEPSWSSVNGGNTWTAEAPGAIRLSSHPNAPAIYVCRAPGNSTVWTPTDLKTMGFDNCNYMTGDAANPNTIYFTTLGGSMGRSVDGGATVSNLSVPGAGAIAVSGNFVATGWKELRVSSDGGSTWSMAALPAKGTIKNLLARGTVLYALAEADFGTVDGILGRVNVGTGIVDVLAPLAGGQAETVHGVAADAAGNLYAAGTAALPADAVPSFPVTTGAIRSIESGGDGFALKLTSTTCTVGVSPTSWTVPAGGGTLTVNITASSCGWSIAQLPSWITTTGPLFGNGNATIQLTAAANPTLAPRAGSFVVAETSVAVTQATACIVGLTPSTQNVGLAQGSTQFSVTTSQPYCAWSATWTATWIAAGGPVSGTGSGTISLTYQANSSVVERQAVIDVSGRRATLRQAGGTCTLSLRQTSGSIGAAGGLHQVVLNGVIAGCDSTATTTAAWIRVTTLGGFVGLAAATNTGPARSATVTVVGQTYTLNQAAGAGCSFSLDRSAISTTAEGELAGIAVKLTAAPASCAWAAFSRASWVQVYPLQGTGSGDVWVIVLPSFSNRARSTTVDIAGQTLTVSQGANAETEIRRLVRLLYFGFFGRVASSAEVDFHVGSLATISQAQMAENFLVSAEFALAGKYIAGLYVGLLDRDAEYGGWEFNRNALARGRVQYNVVASAVLTGAEYRSRFGTPDNRQFVRLLYRHILGREASEEEVIFQSSYLNSIAREWLAHSLLVSDEFRLRTASRLTAMLLPAALLMRDTTEAERITHVRAVEDATTIRTLIAQMMGSAEFAALYK